MGQEISLSKLAYWLCFYGLLFLVIAPSFDLLFVVFSLGLALMFGWISVSDISANKIPNLAVLGVAVLGVIFLLVYEPAIAGQRIIVSLATLVVIYLIVKIASTLTKALTLGFGDVKLIAASGLWLGLTGLYLALFVALLLSLVLIGLARLLGKRAWVAPMPLGPAICMSVWAFWLNNLGPAL